MWRPGRFRIAIAVGALVLLAGAATYLLSRPTVIRGGAAPLSWAECRPAQIQVMILGALHFAQVADELDVLEPDRQEELDVILDRLEHCAVDPEDERLLLVIGHGHMRMLKQVLEITPQLCPVDPVPYLSAAGGDREPA